MASASLSPRVVPALLFLLLHGIAAALLLRWLPQGFPAAQLRFWSNFALPLLIGGACMVGLLAARRPQVASGIVWGLAGLWAGGGIVASLFFPRSLPLAWLGGVALAGVLGGLARRAWRLSWGRVGVLVLPGALLGAVLVLAQRAPPSSTRPINEQMPALDSGWGGGAPSWQSRDGKVSVSLEEPTIRVECGGLKLRLAPLLTFTSRSPDRAWSNLAPAKTNEVPRQLIGLRWTNLHVQAWFRDDGLSTFDVIDMGDTLEIEAFSALRTSVFSHLNSWLGIEIEGQPSLGLEFSAMPGKPVEIRPFEYPAGLPARAAYLTADNMLRVVEARAGEKGPYQLLQEGKLEGSLALTLLDEQGPACRIELADWASQVSTEPSPTAGWGLPQNAIEFHRTGTAATAPAQVVLTLAGTSLGRGWSTVGHAPGIYRNRIKLRSLRDGAPEHPPH